MGTYALETVQNTTDLVRLAHGSAEPLIVMDGEDEGLVAMSPAVFERILFDTDLLNAAQRETLHL